MTDTMTCLDNPEFNKLQDAERAAFSMLNDARGEYNRSVSAKHRYLLGLWLDALEVAVTPRRLVALPLPETSFERAAQQSAYSQISMGYLLKPLHKLEHSGIPSVGPVELSRQGFRKIVEMGQTGMLVLPRETVMQLLEGGRLEDNSSRPFLMVAGNMPFIRKYEDSWGVLFPYAARPWKGPRDYIRWKSDTEEDALQIAVLLASQTPAAGSPYLLPPGRRAAEKGVPVHKLFY